MFKIDFCGVDHVHDGNFVYGIDKHDFWLLLHLKTSALLHLPEGDVVAPANSAVLYPPKDLVYYEGCEETFANSYLRFRTDELCVLESKIPLKTPILLRDPFGMDLVMRLLINEEVWQFRNTSKSTALMLKLLMNKLRSLLMLRISTATATF